MLPLIFAAVLSTGIWPMAVECSDSQHAWSWKAHEGTYRSEDADKPGYRLPSTVTSMPPGGIAQAPDATSSIMDNLRATARACYEIGRMVEQYENMPVTARPEGMARAIQTGRAACFVDGQP